MPDDDRETTVSPADEHLLREGAGRSSILTRLRCSIARWPAYVTAGVTAAYGLLKAYWVLGGEALWNIAPLPASLIEQVRTHTAPTWFVVGDALTVGLAVVGVLVALGTVHPPRWMPPVRLARLPLMTLSALMMLRAVVAATGDASALAAGTLTTTGFWDLVLWSPLFLIWGLLWAATALTYAHRSQG